MGVRRPILRRLLVLVAVIAGTGALTVTAAAAGASGDTAQPSTGGSSYNGLALTPPMGFNNWAGFECNARFGEKLFLDTADALVRLGLDKLGYNQVNIDDCWMKRDRGPDGNLQVDTTRFPGTDPRLPAGSTANPLKALGDYIHSKGLKFGIYEDAGYKTCQGAAGSYGHFQQDANLYASWGVDYLKLDYCYQPLDQYPHKTRAQVAQIVYTQASQALLNTGRPIVFSASAPAYECCSGGNFWQEFQWLPKVANLWRFGSDIADNWASVMENYTEDNTPGLPERAGPGHWNDADMLEIGNGGLSLTEEQSQFTLWAEMASPLLLSTDLSTLTPAELAVVGNPDIIAVDQDPLGRQGKIVDRGKDWDVLSRPLANGDYAVVLFNKADHAQTITTTPGDIGLGPAKQYMLTDLVSKARTETAGRIAANVPAHGTVIYRVRAAAGAGLPPSTVLTLSSGNLNAIGQPTTTTATLTDNGSTPIEAASINLSAPGGWSVQPANQPIGAVAPGHPGTATFSLSPPPPPKGKTSQTLNATANYTWKGSHYSTAAQETVLTDVPYDNLAEAFNNIGITDETNPTPGNFDGDGNSYSAQALAAGDPADPADPKVTPGTTITVAGASFTWPNVPTGTADNVAGGGLTVKLNGQGSKLAFLGAEAGFVSDTVTIHYTDGSTSTASLGFPNWCCTDPTAYGAQVAFYGLHRDTQSGPANYGIHYQVFYNAIPINSTKTLAAVTLPNATQIHIFDMTLQP
jgi:alpha-galactosidase